MPLPGTKEKILKYIEEHDGKRMKQDVVDYMSSESASSRVPTLNLIKELKSENRIKVSGTRKGQSHYLSINRDNDFDEITKKLKMYNVMVEKFTFTEVVKPRKGRPWTWTTDEEVVRFGLDELLVRASMIPVRSDAQMLEKKITDLMKAITLKKIRAMKDL